MFSTAFQYLDSDLTRPPMWPESVPNGTGYANGTRVIEPEDALERLQPFFAPLGLEYLRIDVNESIGMPVYWSYHPLRFSLGRPSDEWNYGGKGVTDIQAKVSMMAESIERMSATRVQNPALVRASLSELGELALPPEKFGIENGPLPPNSIQEWGYARSIFSSEARLLHASLLLHPYTPVVGSRTTNATFNGLVSGCQFHEALLHGLYELIERDAWVLFNHHRPSIRMLNVEQVADEHCQAIMRWFAQRGVEMLIFDISTEMPAYTFAAMVFDEGLKDAPIMPVISGTHSHPLVALTRVLTELCQLRANIIFTKERSAKPTSLFDNQLLRQRYLLKNGLTLEQAQDFNQLPPLARSGVKDELAYVMQGLQSEGVDVYASILAQSVEQFYVLRLNAIGLQPLTAGVQYLGEDEFGNRFDRRWTARLEASKTV